MPLYNPPAEEAVSGGTPTEQTTTATGTNNNFDLTTGRYTLLRCNNASALVITGFTVNGAAPQGGDTVIVNNVGTSTVRVAHQDTNSTDVNRCVFPSTRGQILGASGSMTLVYDTTTDRWRVVAVDPGLAIAVAFDAGNFTATGSMTWTVESGDVRAFKYTQRGAQVTIALAVADFTTGGTADTTLRALLPNSFTAANQGTVAVYAFGRGRANGGTLQGVVAYTAAGASTFLHLDKFDGSTWANGTNNGDVQGSVTLFVD